MEHARQTIQDLEEKLVDLNSEARKLKTTINCLCEVLGEPPRYADTDEKPQKNFATRPDEYYGRPLATVITEVLEKRQTQSQGATTLDELYSELVSGGFKFAGKNDGIKKRGLAISMSKNSKFHRLPNDTWGLTEWYPNRETNKQPKPDDNVIDELADDDKDIIEGIIK